MGPWVGLELERWPLARAKNSISLTVGRRRRGGDVPATARQQGTGKIMLGRARSRAQALATCTPRLPCRVPRANNIRRPSGSITVARPAVRGHHRVPPGLCAGARTADPRRQSGPGRAPCRSRCPTRRRRQASAPPCRAAARPTAPPARHHVLLPRGPRRRRGQFPGRVGRAFAGRADAQAGPILVLLRAALQCHTARPATLVLLVPPVANAMCIQSPTLVHKINQRVEGHLAARGGGPGLRRARGGLFFAVPSFASRRF